MGLTLVASQPTQATSPEVQIAQAMRTALAGDPESGFVAINAIVESDPDSVLALATRAEIEIRLGLYRLAERDLVRSMAQSGGDTATRIALARLSIKEGKLAVIDELSDDDRKGLAVVFLLEGVGLRTGGAKTEEIVSAIDHSIALAPDAPWGYALRSAVYSDLAQYEAAIADIERAISRAPDTISLNVEKVALLEEAEEWQRLLDFTDELVAANPENALFLAYRGLARFSLTPWDSDPGFNEVTEALRMDPEDAEIYLLRAGIRQREGDRFGAIADAARAIQLDPSLIMAHVLKAALTENLEEAQNLVRRAPNNPRAWIVLANTLLEKGPLSPSIPAVLEIAEKLEKMGFDPKAANLLRYLARQRAHCLEPFKHLKTAGGCQE